MRTLCDSSALCMTQIANKTTHTILVRQQEKKKKKKKQFKLHKCCNVQLDIILCKTSYTIQTQCTRVNFKRLYTEQPFI